MNTMQDVEEEINAVFFQWVRYGAVIGSQSLLQDTWVAFKMLRQCVKRACVKGGPQQQAYLETESDRMEVSHVLDPILFFDSLRRLKMGGHQNHELTYFFTAKTKQRKFQKKQKRKRTSY